MNKLNNTILRLSIDRPTNVVFRSAKERYACNAKNVYKSLISRPILSTAIVIASLFLPIVTHAEDAARLINQANAAVRSGDIDAALADYEQAAAVQPNLPELQYNEAVARYRKGEIEQARQLFHEVVTGGDAQLAGQARYNLANCDYADAVKLSEQDKPTAIEKLRSAISHYRGALESNSNDSDARANIELANMLIKQLQEQQKQEQKQQDQQKRDQQQDQQNKDEQQQKKDQQSKDENSEQNESDKQDQQQSQDSQKQDQKSDSSQDQNKQNQESQQDQPQDQQDQSQSADQQKQQDSQTGNPEEPKDEQSQEQQEDQGKGGQLQAANPSEEQDDQQATSSAIVNAGDEERPMTKEEAQKMLQAVRDRDLLRRMQRLQDQRSRHIPVDRDW